MTGQQDGIGDYIHLARYNITSNPSYLYNMGDANYVYPITPQAYDPTIRWETTITCNVGIDYGFFNDRLSGSVDAYIRNTTDLLLDKSKAPSTGVTTAKSNLGELQNKGIEFQLDGYVIRNNDNRLFIFKTVSKFFKSMELHCFTDSSFKQWVVGFVWTL